MVAGEEGRDVEVRWDVMSRSVLNEGREGLPEQYREMLATGWGPVRVCIAAEQEHGSDALGPLYTALGTRFHNKGMERTRATIVDALQEAGLPESLADAADSSAYDERLRASHKEGIDLVGQAVGTPVIAVPGEDGSQVAFFGPVVTPAPKGEAAAQLWDGTLMVASTPGFYEIKRTRTAPPQFD
jgi:hypothetical protein